MQKDKRPYLSIVIPIFNNVEELALHIEPLRRWLGSLSYTSEIIFVDDASLPKSAEQLKRLIVQSDTERLLSHTQNKGQEQALITGFTAARGNILISSDADFVVPPSEFSKFVAAIEQGSDLALGCRVDFQYTRKLRRWGAIFLRVLLKRFFGVGLKDFGCGTCALTATLRDAFFRATLSSGAIKLRLLLLSLRPVEIDLACTPQHTSASSYSYTRLIRLFLNVLGFCFKNRTLLSKKRTL